LLVILSGAWIAPGAVAQPAATGQTGAPDRELVIGTRVTPPFAMKGPDGTWQGISIDLWRHLAERLKLKFRFEERDTVQALVDAVTRGEVDAASAALTVTAARREVMDFTQPFFTTGLGVAVPRGGANAWLPVLRTFLSYSFLQGVLTLLAIALAVGTLIWLFERRENPHYGGPARRGFIAGIYWSAIAMTQAGAAQDGPRSLAGRALAMVWMVASVVTIAVFIAGITSALTTQRLQGLVRTVNDLRDLRVGAVAGSSSAEFLTAQRIAFVSFPQQADGLRAVQAGRLNAFVHDRPLLGWTIQQDFPQMELLPITLDSQSYAIALPRENRIRATLDVALLETLRSPWWEQTRFRYLGRDPSN
jgi:polar amino acid transport system substrate-binding protein